MRGSAFPVLSNDGSTVVFTSNADLTGGNADGNVEIFAANFDGTNLRQLTDTSSGVNGPFVDSSGLVNVLGLAVSADGSIVSFVSNAPIGSEDGTSQEVFTIHSDGTNLQQITDGTVANAVAPTLSIIGVSMSGDASLITFASTGNYNGNNSLGLSQIYTINSDGTNLQQLTGFGQVQCPEGHGSLCISVFATPTMSNDGGRIGYLRTLINIDNQAVPEFLNSEPFIINSDGTGLRQLYSTPAVTQNCSPASLSQDGSRATFICYDSSTDESRLYINNAQGDGLQDVVGAFSGSGTGSAPSINNAGTTIAFEASSDLSGQNSDGNLEIFLASLSTSAVGATALENPTPGSIQSGVSAISGWTCNSGRVDIVIDDTFILQAVHGTDRADTETTCGDRANGFGLLMNWNLIPPGPHTLSARLDGMEFARVTFTVTALGGAEFTTDLSGEFTLDGFPHAGDQTVVHWEPGLQAFQLGPAGPGGDSVSGSGTKIHENPGDGTAHSGVGVISGWVCDAEKIEIIINDSIMLEAAYGISRADTEDACGDQNNGYALLINWNLLGNGEHTITILADGEEFTTVTFTVTTLGEEFVTGLSGDFVIEDFPESGTNTLLTWFESLQNFVITGTTPGS